MDIRKQRASFIDTFLRGKKNLTSWKPQHFCNVEASADVLDFFCCSGGMSLGFASLSETFHIAGGIDINPTSLKSYKANYHTPVLEADVTSLGGKEKEILKAFGIKDTSSRRPLIIIGCAPCQGFSAHRKKDYKKGEDERNTLIGYFAEIAVTLSPTYVVMENVPEILTGKYKSHYEEAKSVFESHGYHVVQHIYNAAGFGVAQARNRAIIVATKDKKFLLPQELYEPCEYNTVRDAIGELPPIDPQHQHPVSDPYHRCSSHRQNTIDVISLVPKDGGSRPAGIGPACLDKVKGFGDVYGRLSWDKPSVTITQYARNPASGRYCHPEQNRGLSIREVARLQSFPDGYIWEGSLGDKYKQIGEAVPPLLSLAIASQIAVTLKKKDNEQNI